MKNYIPWIIIIALIFLLLFPKACDNNEKVTVKEVPHKIPEIKGEIKKPTKSEEITVEKPDTVFIAGLPIYITSPLNPELLKELENSKSELERYKLLSEANRKREYSNDYNNDTIDINVKSTVFGTLVDSEVKYTIKERTVLIPEKTVTKTDNFGLLLTAKYNHSLDSEKINNVEAGAGLRFNKVSIIGTINTQKQVGTGLIIEF